MLFPNEPHKRMLGKPRVNRFTQHAAEIVMKQGKGKALELGELFVLSILNTLSSGNFLKLVMVNDQKKEEAMAKGKGTWVQPTMCLPAPPRETHYMRTAGKESELLEPVRGIFGMRGVI